MNPNLEKIYDGLVASSYAVVPDFLSSQLVAALAADSERLAHTGAFRKARIGRADDLKARDDIRSDEILWFEPEALTQAQNSAWSALEELRKGLNENLYLGLNEFEAHYARYEAGTAYGKHVDRFNSDDSRVISVVLYLNDSWLPSDGGQLRLFPEGSPAITIQPTGGTLVCFLSDKLEHEVLPSSTRTRLSIAAWFKKQKSPLKI